MKAKEKRKIKLASVLIFLVLIFIIKTESNISLDIKNNLLKTIGQVKPGINLGYEYDSARSINPALGIQYRAYKYQDIVNLKKLTVEKSHAEGVYFHHLANRITYVSRANSRAQFTHADLTNQGQINWDIPRLFWGYKKGDTYYTEGTRLDFSYGALYQDRASMRPVVFLRGDNI